MVLAFTSTVAAYSRTEGNVAQDFIHNPVGYLQVNGFVLLEIHRLKSFRSVICDVANNL